MGSRTDVDPPGVREVEMQQEAILIRAYRDRDWHALWPLLREIAADGDSFTFPTTLTELDARRIWLPGAPAATIVAIDDDGSIVGSAKIGPNQMGPGSHVATMSCLVGRRHRGRGIGRMVARWTIAWAKQRNYAAMQFNAVVETNLAAVALWQSLGFEIIATIPEAFELPSTRVNLLVMHRFL